MIGLLCSIVVAVAVVQPTPAEAASSASLKVSTGKHAFKKVGAKAQSRLAHAVVTVPAGGRVAAGFQLRSSGTAKGYRLGISVAKSGAVTGVFSRVLKSKATKLRAAPNLGLTAKAGDKLHIEVSVVAKIQVRLYLRVWKAGTKKPTAWQAMATDSSKSRLSKPGTTYLWSMLPNGRAGSVKFSSLKIQPFTLGKAKRSPVVPPTVKSKVAAPPAATTPKPPVTTPSPSSPPGAGKSVGVPAGTKLTRIDGDLVITKPGTVISNAEIHGFVTIRADNVTIKNSVIRGRKNVEDKHYGLIMSWSGSKNLRIVDSTVKALHPSLNVEGISGSNIHIERVEIANVVDGVKTTRLGNVTVRDSWIHSGHFLTKEQSPNNWTHSDGIQVEGGPNIVVSGNTIEGYYNAAVMVTQNVGVIDKLDIVSNHLAGGGCSINLSDKGKGAPQNVVIADNQFHHGTTTVSNCPMIFKPSTTISLSGNTWMETGAAAVPKVGG